MQRVRSHKGTPVRNFRDLEAWHLAMQLVTTCYEVARALPPDERYELSAQLRRAAVSVPSNIAEGHSSRSLGLFHRHLGIALGSLEEVDALIEVGLRVGLFARSDAERARAELTRTNQVVHGLRRSVRARLAAKLGGTAVLIVLSVLPLLR